MSGFKLFFKFMAISIKSQLQYRGSFLMMSLGHFIITGIEIFAVWSLFQRFHTIAGWNFEEIAILYALANLSFALAEGLGRGFDMFGQLVKSGEFDRMLLRPRSTVLQVSSNECQLMRIGRFSQAMIVLFYASNKLMIYASWDKICILVISILGGACLFYGLFIIQATISFWTTETLELMNTVTYGGIEAGSYPIDIYHDWFRKLFIYIIPVACVTYFPVLYITGKQDKILNAPIWFSWIAPFSGIVFLLISIRLWHYGVSHYHSTGS